MEVILLFTVLGLCAAVAVAACMLGSVYSRDEESDR
jgi:hypothetical protein